MERNVVTSQIISAAMTVHTALGPGLLESVYRLCLAHALKKRGLRVSSEKSIPIHFDGLALASGLRLDLVVEDSVVVEVKSVEKMKPLYTSQLLSYLKLSGLRTGLLLNFNVRHMRNGITRMVR